ncbi:MAG TPA: ABC transporter ATP-binding protein [Anaerolineae bacterium]|nr:ABC transporter ATP-binding protein [Anaerolineae bacterium]
MIEAENLSKAFSDFVAVDGVSLQVEPGQVVALLGPNGAGKTTTVRVLAALLSPTSGRARVAGFDVVRHPIEVRRRVGVLTEAPGLYLRSTAREYLDFFGSAYGMPAARRGRRAALLLSRFGMAGDADRRLSQFSKGMQQKLALIRCMLHDPPVLLLDEPTSAMDPQSARIVRDALLELKTDARAIILCTHNLTEAEEIADQIAIIRRGRIIALGAPVELKQRLLGPPLMELRLVQPANGLFTELQTHLDVEAVGETWIRFRTTEPELENPRLLRWLAQRQVDVLSLSEVPRRLEDVYLNVVK